MNKNDYRYLRTDKMIKLAFKKCVDKNGFEKVYVSDICKEAMINRNTFYLHYSDKYDLLEELFKDFIKSFRNDKSITFVQSNLSKDNYIPTNKWYIENMFTHREEFLFLAKCSHERMEKTIRSDIFEWLLGNVIPNYNELIKEPSAELQMRNICGGIYAFTEYWLQNYTIFTKQEAFELYKNLLSSPSEIFMSELKKIQNRKSSTV